MCRLSPVLDWVIRVLCVHNAAVASAIVCHLWGRTPSAVHHYLSVYNAAEPHTTGHTIMRRFTPSWGAGKPDPEPGVDVELSATSLPGPCATVESLVGLNNIVSAEQTDVWEAHIQKVRWELGTQPWLARAPLRSPNC